MSERELAIDEFLNNAGWGAAKRSPVPGDASTRSYIRLERDGEHAVMMNSPYQTGEVLADPADTPEIRIAKGYPAAARLAGSGVAPFIAIAGELSRRGFSAPRVLAADTDHGFALLEDFGASVYARVIADDPAQEAPLYAAAVETLGEIYRSSFPVQMQAYDAPWTVQAYDTTALLTEVDLFLDWYVPDFGIGVSDDAKAEFHGLWTEAFACLSAHAPGLALRDFHAENLFWLPERDSVARVGLIDFQDALFAHPAYDLVSFLEDARRDVSRDLVEGLISQFCEAAKIPDEEAFRRAYAVMGAQRNAKILGIFIRLAERDEKPSYRALIPRVKAHFLRNLNSAEMAPIAAWLTKHMPEVMS